MIKWFHSLKVSQKLMLISIFFMMPDSIMLYLFITEINANISVARLEQVGNQYQRPLETLLDLVPRHRILMREMLAGDALAKSRLRQVSTDIDSAFDALEAVDARIGTQLEFTREGLAKHDRKGCDPRTVRREWDRLTGKMDDLQPEERDSCDRSHLKLIADLRTMISQAGDVSNLILDPDIDSYYLMDVTLLALPQTQDRLAQVTADGADLLRAKGTDPELRIRVAVGLAQLHTDDLDRIIASTNVALNDNKQGDEMGGVCGSFESKTPPALAGYVAAAKHFDELTARIEAGDTKGITPTEYVAAGMAARDASLQYWQVAVDQLDSILQNRIGYYTWRRTRSLGVAGCALMGACLLVTFITRSISNPLKQKAARAIAEGEDRIARITANVPGMVYQHVRRPDGSSSYTFVSDGSIDVFGLDPDTVRANVTAPESLVLAEDLPSFKSSLAEASAALHPWKWEGRIRHGRTGAIRWIACNCRLEQLPDGGVLGNGVVTDVTAIKVAEAAADAARKVAEQASIAKSEFLANMSHEIRTPLNGVIGMVDLLQNTPLAGQQTRYTQVIRSSSDTLLSLINDILDFSKIEAGKMELEEIDFDLGIVTEEVAALLAPKAAGKGLELACDIDTSVQQRVRGDGDRLRQVLTNLVNNAIKFTTTGEIVMRVTAGDAQAQPGSEVVRFAVSDTGIGIPRERLDRLFKSFSQVDSSTTRRFGGTGLGLAISKQLVELMGGTIGVSSEPGQGSTFWFTVTLRRQAVPAAAVVPNAMTGRRLLVADANPTQRRILQNQLSAWGARVSTVGTGESAVSTLSNEASNGQPFAAAIVDADLPDLAGAALVSAIRCFDTLQSLPLILTSGIRSNIDPADAPSHGFAAGLAKPIRQSLLFDAIINSVLKPAPLTAVPVAQMQAAIAPAASLARILLVDDNEVNRYIAIEILARAGYACDTATNGREAVDAISRRAYELVLMDCQMPEMGGFEAAAIIRQREQQTGCGRTCIIALTANALKGDRESCLAAGMDDYLTKPWNRAQLIRMVESHIGPGAQPLANAA